jgi:hypothetical protein
MRIPRSISEMKNLRPPPQPQLNFPDDMTLIFRQQFQAFCTIFRAQRPISKSFEIGGGNGLRYNR